MYPRANIKSLGRGLGYLATIVLLNPAIPCQCKQCRSRSVGFCRSQLIWICTVCHSVCEFTSTVWIKKSSWLKIGSGRGILIYSTWQGLKVLDTLGALSAFSYKGDNFYDFLFDFLHTNLLLKNRLFSKERIFLQGREVFTVGKTLFQKGDKTLLKSYLPWKCTHFC